MSGIGVTAARGVLWSTGLLVRGSRALGQLASSVALGLLDDDEVAELTRRHYAGAEQYTLQGFNDTGLRPWEKRAIERWFPAAGRVLVLAAGGGREAFALADLGFDIVAADCEPRYVDALRSGAADHPRVCATLLVAPDAVPTDSGELQAAVVGWSAYTHVVGRERRIHVLRELSRQLPSGGPILLSFFVRSALNENRVDRWAEMVTRRLAMARGRSRQPEAGDRLTPPGYFAHAFVRDEIASECEEAGLELVYWSEAPYGHAVARRA